MGRKVATSFFVALEDGSERHVVAGTELADDDPAALHEAFLVPDAAVAEQAARDAAADEDHQGAQITADLADTAAPRRRGKA